jgi:hypothetical protein
VPGSDGALPAPLTTGGTSTDGVTLLVVGSNFALGPGNVRYTSTLVVYFNDGNAAANASRPTDAQLSSYYSCAYAGLGCSPSANAAFASWISTLATPAFTAQWLGPNAHQLTVTVPPGFGIAREVIVNAGGVFSQVNYAGAPTTSPTFSYAPPRISNVAPDKQRLQNPANLRLVIDGYNAPLTGGNFVDLVNKGFYNKRIITRSDGFVVQTGDADPAGPEGPGPHGYVPVLDFTRGLVDIGRHGEDYQTWLKAGGAQAAIVALGLDGEWFDEDTDIYGPHPFLRTTRERIVDWHHDDHGVPVWWSKTPLFGCSSKW